MLRILAATASFDAWDAAYGDGGDLPSSEPEPFKHAQAEAREYWQGLAAQIHVIPADGTGRHERASTMTIEQRITAALTNRDIKSDALAELIVETESAIAAAEKAAEAERAKALDPLQSPDAAAARRDGGAQFAVQRLRTMLPRLQRYPQVGAQENYDAWAATFDPLLPKHQAAADKLRTVYTEFARQACRSTD